jgi:micrococcal nuclease
MKLKTTLLVVVVILAAVLACGGTETPALTQRLETRSLTPTTSPNLTSIPVPTELPIDLSQVSPAPTPIIHVVQAGETLGKIAQQYGVPLEAIVAANNIADPALIQVGQELIIPSAGATVTSLPKDTPVPAEKPAVTRETARVIQVIDGDTTEVETDGQRYTVRYIGMDTPERDEPFYVEATEANRQLVEGQVVEMEKDVSETDRYGRLLRYVYIGDLMVNEELLRLGMAQVATFPPDVKFADRFLAVQQAAQADGVGLWAALAPLPPEPTATLPSPAVNCEPSYPDVCIPPPPPDLDCGDIAFRRFTVLPPDPHRFDGDHDGVGCER